MSHHGREDEPTHSEADWRAACRDAQDCRQAIRTVLDGTWTLDNLRNFAEANGIVRTAAEIARQKRTRATELRQQMVKLQAELAELAELEKLG